MRKLLFLLAFFFVGGMAFGQDGGVVFLDNEPWDKVVRQAKKENKLIFVDCYTIWCGPCNRLTNEVFPQKEMGDYMNPKFVCVKYDVDKGEGAKFKELYASEIPAFPTLLVVNTEGKILHRLVGYQPMKPLINSIQRGLDGVNIYTMREEYPQHKNEKAFVKDFLWALRFAYIMDEYATVAREFTSRFPQDSLLTKDFWEMASPIVVNDPYCEEYPFILKNLYALEKLGVDQHALEEELNFYMGITVNQLYIAVLHKRKGVLMEDFGEKVAYLRPLLKTPVKGFSVRQIELAAIECMYNDDVDKLYERMHVFMDCDMVVMDQFMEEVFRYMMRNLTDKRKIEECVDYIKNKTGVVKFVEQSFVELGEQRIKQLSGEESK